MAAVLLQKLAARAVRALLRAAQVVRVSQLVRNCPAAARLQENNTCRGVGGGKGATVPTHTDLGCWSLFRSVKQTLKPGTAGDCR
jgi:hypothetical protein